MLDLLIIVVHVGPAALVTYLGSALVGMALETIRGLRDA